ncbi:hypothetical protein NP493_979g01012 [Ridgeia piscesae]|uniref:ATP synthase subunit f, mitochondrial n=1 Tax=Ridgeia piscesae TaxID=27915 RepID=A0AAD9KJ38_RIDPI|nr:hypothetical protein NP493_979g01012 [Ridgeia piscesae]
MPLGIGEYPPEYNPKVHGQYSPARYYGKPDTKLADVKLGQLGDWFTRRSYNPMAVFRATGRAYWRWAEKWMMVKKPSVAPVCHVILGLSLFYYIQLYSFVRYHRHTKYHW